MVTNLQGSSHRPRAVGFRLRNRKNFIYEFCVAAGMIIHPGSEDIYSVATIRELKEIYIIARDKDKNKRLYDMVNMYNIHQNDVLNDDMRICLKLGIEEGLADG